MVNPESVRSFFAECGSSVLGAEHICIFSVKDLSRFADVDIEEIYSAIHELEIITTMLAYEYGFDSGEAPKRYKKQFEEYETNMFLMNQLDAYLDYIELDPEEKLMIRFLSEKEKNLSTFREAKRGIERFYEKAIPIYPAEVLSFLFEHDDDFNKKTALKTSRKIHGVSYNYDGLTISPYMISQILGAWSEYGLLSGKKKLLDTFIEEYSKPLTNEEILKFDKSSLTEIVGSCFNILANRKILDLTEDQKHAIMKINLEAIKQVMIEHLHNKPGAFYVVPHSMSAIRWNQDDGNIIYRAFNEPYFDYSELPDDLRVKFAKDYVEILLLAKKMNHLSSFDVVENILCQNDRLKKVDSSFSDRVVSCLVENLKQLNIQKDIFEDVQAEGTLNLKKALKTFIETTSEKDKILDLLDSSQRKSFGKFQMKSNVKSLKNSDESLIERGEE